VIEICLIILLNIKLYFIFGILYLNWIICHLIYFGRLESHKFISISVDFVRERTRRDLRDPVPEYQFLRNDKDSPDYGIRPGKDPVPGKISDLRFCRTLVFLLSSMLINFIFRFNR